MSYIFLTDNFVYKVKKPVDFGFLNFTTLDRRRFYCEEEVRLNSRLSPDLYIGVVELRESDGGGSFCSGGKVLDYAVKMKRLPAQRMLDVLVDRGDVTEANIRRLAGVIADFHQRADRNGDITRFGSIEVIRGNWDDSFRLVRNFINVVLSRRDFRIIEEWVDTFLRERAPLLASRMAEGFIRDCDGDLHLQNICIDTDNSIHIFDCIEFNDKFRFGDTAADIAFLTMDLEFHRRSDLADLLLKEYRKSSGDPLPDELLEFYKCYRAFVRGKVEALKLHDLSIPPEERNEARAHAAAHFRLARAYALRRKLPPTLFLTCGSTGTGKSTVALELSRTLGIRAIRTDVVRKRLYAERMETQDDDLYSAAMTEATYAGCLDEAQRDTASGTSAIVDGTFRKKKHREMFRELALAAGMQFVLIRTSCPERLVRKRLTERAATGSDVSDGRWEHFPTQEAEFEAPDADDPSVVIIDTSRPVAESVDTILLHMGVIT